MRITISLILLASICTVRSADLGTITIKSTNGEPISARVIRVDSNEVAVAVGSAFTKVRLQDLKPEDQERMQTIYARRQAQAKAQAEAERARMATIQKAQAETEKERTMLDIGGVPMEPASLKIEVDVIGKDMVSGYKIVQKSRRIPKEPDRFRKIGIIQGAGGPPDYDVETWEEHGDKVYLKVLPEHLDQLRTGKPYETSAAKTGFQELKHPNGSATRYDLYQEGKPYKSTFLQQLRTPKPPLIITNSIP